MGVLNHKKKTLENIKARMQLHIDRINEKIIKIDLEIAEKKQ